VYGCASFLQTIIEFLFDVTIFYLSFYFTCFKIEFNITVSVRETNPTWDVEIRDDVIEECNKHGGVLHVYVDKASPQGNVYVKCPSIATAVAAVNSLHGRWFAGKLRCGPHLPVVSQFLLEYFKCIYNVPQVG
jgi:hypothetical protein